jgi:hypothetical protein
MIAGSADAAEHCANQAATEATTKLKPRIRLRRSADFAPLGEKRPPAASGGVKIQL